ELGQHGRHRSNVWDYPAVNTMRPGRLDELAMHPTVKPVALVADARPRGSGQASRHRRGATVLFSWPSRGEVRLVAYAADRESASSSRDALSQLQDTISQNPNVTEITVLAHSMGCQLTLEALRARAIRSGSVGGKIKNVLLVAPDVSIDEFPTDIQQMGNKRPRVALFVSQNDPALDISRTISGG